MKPQKSPTSVPIVIPSAADKPPPEPNNVSPPSEGPENPVHSLLSLIKEFCAGGDFSRLKAMCQENKELSAKINQLESAYDQNIQALTRSENKWQSEHRRYEEADRVRADALEHLKQERDVSQGLRDRVRHMEEKVKTAIATSKSWESQTMELTNSEKAKTTDLKNAQQAITKVEGELQLRKEELASKTTELARVQDNFKVIRSFVIDLQSLADKGVLIQNLLANFFDLALKHMEAFLRSDLDDACLADSATWIELRMRVSSQQRIPLPASNSPGAKRMRIVAGLVIFGEALADYIFRPTHTAQDSELDDVLGRLGTQNYLQEMYVRAALLRVLPDRQRKNQEAAVKSVVTHVSDVLGVLMPSSRRGEFESRLKLVSDEICHGWSQVQQLEERVRPSFSFDFAEEWQPLPSSGPQTSTKPNPSPSTQSTTQQQKNGRQTQQQPKPRPEVLTKEEFKEVAWPAFLATNPEQAQDGDGANSSSWVSIHRGYVLTKAQAKGAEQERTAEEEASRRVRKTIRQNDGNDPRQTQRKRRDSGIGGFFHS
ncbi:hypothetical protein BKA56DRAFT_505358 [Ilyonectria sp. MPI-CAGE-AT-0026]|nr:hypothetical protein BKA56DRAFT_505358 [Ilyonectria sp. MPI-CAGE-AT-0026]